MVEQEDREHSEQAEDYSQLKRKSKSLKMNETEINNLPGKELKNIGNKNVNWIREKFI